MFSGPCREGDLGHELRITAEQKGVRSEVINMDIVGQLDIMDEDTYNVLVSLAHSGAVHLLHRGCLCSSWSRARLGPPVLRTRAFPVGGDPAIPPVCKDEWLKLEAHNEMTRRSVELSRLAATSTTMAAHSLENPEDPGVPYASLFASPFVEPLRKLPHVQGYRLDQCRFGLSFKKPTQFLSDAAGFAGLQKRCNHGYRANQCLIGVDESGDFRPRRRVATRGTFAVQWRSSWSRRRCCDIRLFRAAVDRHSKLGLAPPREA